MAEQVHRDPLYRSPLLIFTAGIPVVGFAISQIAQHHLNQELRGGHQDNPREIHATLAKYETASLVRNTLIAVTLTALIVFGIVAGPINILTIIILTLGMSLAFNATILAIQNAFSIHNHKFQANQR